MQRGKQYTVANVQNEYIEFDRMWKNLQRWTENGVQNIYICRTYRDGQNVIDIQNEYTEMIECVRKNEYIEHIEMDRMWWPDVQNIQRDGQNVEQIKNKYTETNAM